MGYRWATQGRCCSPHPSAEKICFHNSGVIYELPSSFWQTVILNWSSATYTYKVMHSSHCCEWWGFINQPCIHLTTQPVQSHLLTSGESLLFQISSEFVFPYATLCVLQLTPQFQPCYSRVSAVNHCATVPGLSADNEIVIGNSYFWLIYSAVTVQCVSGNGPKSKYCSSGNSCHFCVVASGFGRAWHTPYHCEGCHE